MQKRSMMQLSRVQSSRATTRSRRKYNKKNKKNQGNDGVMKNKHKHREDQVGSMSRTLVVAVACAFTFGFAAHWLVLSYNTVHAGGFVQTDIALRETGKYKYTSPLLSCASYEN